jgi:hypothetical protein
MAWEITRPLATLEKRLVIAPAEQCASCRVVRAAARGRPLIAGTRQTTGDSAGEGGGGGVGGGADGLALVKVAVAVRAAAIVTTQVAGWPAQSPVQPAKAAPGLAVAVSETVASSRKLAEQEPPQTRPAGTLVICPFPALLTLKFCVLTLRNFAPLAPAASVAIIVTTRVPGVAYAWATVGAEPLLEVPSPQSQA